MSQSIEFPDREPTYLFDRDCLAFSALVDGKAILCLVTAELLVTRFQARDMSEEAILEAFRTHKAEIEDIARNHIENSWIDEEGRVFLMTRYTRMTVHYEESLGQWPEGLAAAEAAQKVLTGIIGPSAGEVIVEWRADLRPPQMIICRISDPSLRRINDPARLYSVNGFVRSLHWGDTNMLTIILAGSWATLLRERSRQLFLKSG